MTSQGDSGINAKKGSNIIRRFNTVLHFIICYIGLIKKFQLCPNYKLHCTIYDAIAIFFQ